MGSINIFWFIWTAIVLHLVSASSLTVNSQPQGCSLLGIDLKHCLIPSNSESNYKSPLMSLDSCCEALDQAIQAGYYCLCSLLANSEHPVIIGTDLQLSFPNCHISVPPLTHCHEPNPSTVTIAPPATALPQISHQPPLPLELPAVVHAPPHDLPGDDQFVPDLPPKVKEIPLNLNKSSIADKSPIILNTNDPLSSIPERRDYYLPCNGANHIEIVLVHSLKNLLIIAVLLACIA